MKEIQIKRFIDCYIDTEACNFRCPYCYITHRNAYSNKIFKLAHTENEIRQALSKKRLGGVSLFNICAGGETLLSPDVIPIAKALIDEGHYVMIVTNGSLTNRFKEIKEVLTEEELKHLFFKFSFHYSELRRLNLLERYFENIKMMHECGCSITCELTPHDEIIPDIENIKSICKEKLGAFCHVTVARDERTNGLQHLSKLDWEEYKKTWGVFDSELFNFKSSVFYKKRNEFCYAGDWAIFVNLATGQYRPCNCGGVLGNIYTDKKINFSAIGQCQLPHCFNAHAWLAFNCIPGFTKITFADERDRCNEKGEDWLNEEFQTVLSMKLDESNQEYSDSRKRKALYKLKAMQIKKGLGKVYKVIKK